LFADLTDADYELRLRSNIFPNEDAITRLIGALLLEQNDEWAVQRGRYMSLETIAPLSDARGRARYTLSALFALSAVQSLRC
jgi:hypothetical protein